LVHNQTAQIFNESYYRKAFAGPAAINNRDPTSQECE